MSLSSCSFCNKIGHNIRGCDDSAILNVYNQIKFIYSNLASQSLPPAVFKDQFLQLTSSRYRSKDLKAVAVKYTEATASLNKKTLLIYIWRHFRNTMPPPHTQWIEVIHTPIVLDTVPSYAQDLQEPTLLSWDLDNTPILPNIFDLNEYHQTNMAAQYEPTMEEFIPFISRNLMEDFESAESIKKYNIVSVLLPNHMDSNGEKECAICYNNLDGTNIVTLNCDHSFCGMCVKSILLHHNSRLAPTCGLCRTRMNTFVMNDKDTYELLEEYCI